jgi:hypothetical protein
MCVSICSSLAVLCVVLAVTCISVISKFLSLGPLISSKIRASQAKNSQAKPSAWEAVQSILSHVVVEMIQSALREEQGWTHWLLC